MSKPPEQIAADIPDDLADADELLQAFGRWAMFRIVRGRCGSAEGAYQAKPGEEARAPREILMLNVDAMRVQKALSMLPTRLRIVLELLYVPRRQANGRLARPEMMLRLLRIPPYLARDRHAEGLRMFRAIHGRLLPKSKTAAILPPPVTETVFEVCQMAGVGVGEGFET